MMPEAAGMMGDKLLDLALANSNSSFPGLLDTNSLPGNVVGGTGDKDLTLSTVRMPGSDMKSFNGAITSLRQDESWLGPEDLSLSSFLIDSPAKKQLVGAVSHASSPQTLQPQANITLRSAATGLLSGTVTSTLHFGDMTSLTSGTGSLSGPIVHFGESSRDSLLLAGMDSSLQCMLNENSFDLSSKFADLIAAAVTPHDLANVVSTASAVTSSDPQQHYVSTQL
jgi:hypothetical protein